MNCVIKFLEALITTVAILGLPVLTCLSFVFEWHWLGRWLLFVAVVLEAVIITLTIFERSEE